MGLTTICKMQLKDKIDFSYLKSTKQTIFKVVLSILKFAIITALIYLGFYILSLLRLVSILPGIPQNVFSAILTIMLILSIIVCSFGLVKSLYFAKDNFVLLSLPISRTMVFLSKLIVYYIYEFLRNIYYLLPLLIAYGLINKIVIYYYIWLIPAMFILTLIPVVIGGILSIPLLYIGNFIRRYKWLELTLVFAVISLVSLCLIFIIISIPENFDLIGTWGTTFWKIQTVLDKFNNMFLPFTWVSLAIVGTRYGISNELFKLPQILAILGIIAVLMIVIGLTFLIVRPLYFKMASSPFEYRKQDVKKKIDNKCNSPLRSTIKKDLFLTYRTPEKFYSSVMIFLGLPISIFLLNKIYSAMDTRLAGTIMSIAFNILMILLIVLAANVNIAHIYSEEGGANYLLKTSPKPHINILLSRLFINFVSITIAIIATVAIFASFMKINFIQSIIIFLFIECIYVADLLWSAELDIMNPQTIRYQTEGMNLYNPNDLRATIYAVILSGLFAFLTYFFIVENEKVAWLKLFLISAVFLAFRIWSFVNKVKVYFKEKQ